MKLGASNRCKEMKSIVGYPTTEWVCLYESSFVLLNILRVQVQVYVQVCRMIGL